MHLRVIKITTPQASPPQPRVAGVQSPLERRREVGTSSSEPETQVCEEAEETARSLDKHLAQEDLHNPWTFPDPDADSGGSWFSWVRAEPTGQGSVRGEGDRAGTRTFVSLHTWAYLNHRHTHTLSLSLTYAYTQNVHPHSPPEVMNLDPLL